MGTVNDANRILAPEGREFYSATLGAFERAESEVLIGGAYAFARYTGIERHTKDFDVFVRGRDFERTLHALAAAGYETEVSFRHWLGKARCGDYFVDVIHSSGNGVVMVDDEWFANAPWGSVFDIPVKLCPPEEMIWSKSFIQERERFDGADVVHLIKACGPTLDWERLLGRFGSHWHVLLAHLVLFGYVYPGERELVPRWVMQELMRRLETSLGAREPHHGICRGTLLSRQQYRVDIDHWGYLDARVLEDNPMTESDIAIWTAAIAIDGSKEDLG